MMILKTTMKWYWVPAAVLLLGVISLSLILWTDRINEKQRVNYLRIGAIMDVQIHTSKYHLWFEEFLAGDPQMSVESVWSNYEKAVGLMGAILNGGATEHGLMSAPLEGSGLRKQAEEIRSELMSFEVMARKRMESPATSGIGSPLDQQFDAMFGDILNKATLLENSIEAESVRYQTQSKHVFLGIVLVWTLIIVLTTLGLLSRERRRKTSEVALLSAHVRLQAQADELNDHRENLERMVDARTGELTSANKNLQLEIADRRLAEDALTESQEQLRCLSSMLLSAQEDERKKISRELHDGLGQALTVVKFRLRDLKKQMHENQGPQKDDFDDVLKYINSIMEDVRRLSRDLSPSILEDMGLTRSLRWLAQDFEKSHDIRLSLDIADLDDLFTKKDQTSIYRILQEALNNIAKHSGAKNVSIGAKTYEGNASIFIEDDGKGFDPAEAAARKAPEKGLGLASMRERVNILGGVLSMWSDKGKGTRLSFSIPTKKDAI